MSTNKLSIVYEIGISTPCSRGGGSVKFKTLEIISAAFVLKLDSGLYCSDAIPFSDKLSVRSKNKGTCSFFDQG